MLCVYKTREARLYFSMYLTFGLDEHLVKAFKCCEEYVYMMCIESNMYFQARSILETESLLNEEIVL